MATLLTHALLGILIGAAVGVRPRHWAWCALVPMAMDLDHIFWVLGGSDPPWIASRGTLHNVWVAMVLPAAGGAWWLLRDGLDHPWARLVASAPLLMAAHVLFDMIGHNPGTLEVGVSTLYPFTRARFFLELDPLLFDERFLDQEAVLLGVVILLALAVRVLVDRAQRDLGRTDRLRTIAAWAALCGVVVPLLLALVSVRSTL